jgi:hypothetical protein
VPTLRAVKRTLAWLLGVVGGLAFLFVAVAQYDAAYQVPTGRNVAGTIVGLHKNQRTREVSPTRFIARLDDGRSVVVEGTEALVYKPHARIVMQERRSAIFGLRRYAFRRLADPLEEPNNDASLADWP